MRFMWKENPDERPDFRAIVVCLAELTGYSGDIESELSEEAKRCEREQHVYHELEMGGGGSTPSSEPENNVYSVLEEPVYHNYSKDEESLDSPEEYEVPQRSLDSEAERAATAAATAAATGATSEGDFVVNYEVPMKSSIDAAASENKQPLDPHQRRNLSSPSPIPMEYEVPEASLSRSGITASAMMMTTSYVPSSSVPSPKHTPRRPRAKSRSPARQSEFSTSYPKSECSPSHNHQQRHPPYANMPVESTLPMHIPAAQDVGASDGRSSYPRNKRGVSPGYLKLNYPEMQKPLPAAGNGNVASASTDDLAGEKMYSMLEWKKGKLVSHSSNFNTLPSRLRTETNHVYQTLEPAQMTQ